MNNNINVLTGSIESDQGQMGGNTKSQISIPSINKRSRASLILGKNDLDVIMEKLSQSSQKPKNSSIETKKLSERKKHSSIPRS